MLKIYTGNNTLGNIEMTERVFNDMFWGYDSDFTTCIYKSISFVDGDSAVEFLETLISLFETALVAEEMEKYDCSSALYFDDIKNIIEDKLAPTYEMKDDNFSSKLWANITPTTILDLKALMGIIVTS